VKAGVRALHGDPVEHKQQHDTMVADALEALGRAAYATWDFRRANPDEYAE